METLSHLFSKLTAHAQTGLNLIRVHAIADHKSGTRDHTNHIAHLNHQTTVLHALNKYCYPSQIDEIINGYKRSVIDEESIYSDFFNSDIPHHPILRDIHYQRALDIATDRFRPDSLCRPIHLLDVQHHYPLELRSNAEAPFSTDPTFLNMLPPDTKPTTGNMKAIIFNNVRRWHHEIKDATVTFDHHLYYMLLHTKTSIVKQQDPNKLRTIWGVPKPWILAQIMFHWSLFACYRRNPKRYPLLWGYETFTGGWFRLNNELLSSHLRLSFIMIDWKRFDKYVPHEGADDIHDRTKQYIDFDHGYLPTKEYSQSRSEWTPIKAARLKRLYEWTKYAYRNTPIVTPDGSFWRRQHATLPSGLYVTQYYDSFWNYIMISTILLALNFDPEHCIIKVLGDDSLIRLHVLIPPNAHEAFFVALQTQATLYFGSIISLEKSKMTNNLNKVEVLSYTCQYGLPYRKLEELLAKLYFSPSRSPTPGKTMASAVGIAYASCGLHKQVYNVCKDIYEHYQRHGITPESQGLHNVLGGDPFSIRPQNLPLNVFPSVQDIQHNLLNMNYVNKKTYDRFFPRSHFISDF
jgi:hypothetical protein